MEHLNEACWEGYKQVGMKDVKGRMVPNCVPMEEAISAQAALKNAIEKLRGIEKEPTPDLKAMSPEERRAYIGSKAERRHPAVPLDMIARHGKGDAQQQARFALSEPMVEDEINEYCPRCLIDVLMGKHPDQLGEAQYQGRSVPLGKPMRGDVKKFKVYVRDPKTGNIKKVNFGDKTMKIKKSNPARRRSFRARHHCDTNPGPRTKARYWSCRKW